MDKPEMIRRSFAELTAYDWMLTSHDRSGHLFRDF